MRKGLKKDVLFLLSLFIAGGLLLFSYGAHLDQWSEQEILEYNIVSYCEAFRLEGTVYQDLKEKVSIGIQDSIEKDHGMSVFYPLFWIHELNKVSGYWGNIVWHAYIYSFCFLGVICFYLLVKDLFSIQAARFSTLFYFFTPRMFAEMHYNNKDMVILTLIFIIYYLGNRLRRKVTRTNAILFGIAGAFVTNMKIIGFFIWGFIGLYLAVTKLVECHKGERAKLIGTITASVMSWAAVFYLITPAAWGDVIGFFRYVIDSARNFRWSGFILYGGNLIRKEYTGFPRKYIPVMMIKTLPTAILLLGSAGVIISFWKSICKGQDRERTDSYRYCSVAVLGGLIPLAYAVLCATPVYNGWRHFYFVYAAVMVAVAAGIDCWIEIMSGKKWSVNVLRGYILILIVGILWNHPYEYAYYNVFAGKEIECRYELDYWDMAVKQALEKILKEESISQQISVAVCEPYTGWGVAANLPVLPEEDRKRFAVSTDWKDAEYVIANRTYAEIYAGEEYEILLSEYDRVHRMKSYGNTICEVFRKR